MTVSKSADLTVVGAGIFGLWQALVLARSGHRVRLVDSSLQPFANAASRWAGAMISPDCEAESAPSVVRTLGHEGLAIWRSTYPGLQVRGSLVVAAARDRTELKRFAQRTSGGRLLEASEVGALEPSLGGRFLEALYFPDEAHMETPLALAYLLAEVKKSGAHVTFGTPWDGARPAHGLVIDCRGLEARTELASLRGVRGERILLRTPELDLQRPIRLLHPRAALYVVPWSGGKYLVGATVIESEDNSGMSVRSALDLLGLSYALHPAFGEAEILEFSAGVRPAFADNIPRVIVRGRTILVNGAFRHGFLMAPVLAHAVASLLETGETRPEVVTIESALKRD